MGCWGDQYELIAKEGRKEGDTALVQYEINVLEATKIYLMDGEREKDKNMERER